MFSISCRHKPWKTEITNNFLVLANEALSGNLFFLNLLLNNNTTEGIWLAELLAFESQTPVRYSNFSVNPVIRDWNREGPGDHLNTRHKKFQKFDVSNDGNFGIRKAIYFYLCNTALVTGLATPHPPAPTPKNHLEVFRHAFFFMVLFITCFRLDTLVPIPLLLR